MQEFPICPDKLLLATYQLANEDPIPDEYCLVIVLGTIKKQEV